MTSLQDIISSKQEKDVESDNDSFAEADAIPVVPNRPARSKKSEAVPQAEAAVPTPPVPQRPKKRSTEESNSASVPVIPQRPLKKEVGPIVVQEEDSDLNEEVEPDKVNDNKDIDDNLLRPDYNEREAQIEAITSDAESIAELDEYDDEDDEDDEGNEGEELAPDPRTSRPNNGEEEPFPSPSADDFITRVDDELEELKLMTSKRDPDVSTPEVPQQHPHVPHHRPIGNIDPKVMARTCTSDLKNEVEELYSSHHACRESAPGTPASGIIHPQRSQNVPKRPAIATALAASSLRRTGTDELREEVTELYSSKHVCGDSAIATPLDTPLRKDSAVFFNQSSGSQVDVSSSGKEEESAPTVEPVVPKRPSKSKQVLEEVVSEKQPREKIPEDEASKPLPDEPIVPQRPTKSEPVVPKRPSKPVPEEEPVVPERPVSAVPELTTEPKIEQKTTDEPSIPERPKAKGPPVIPKKPSSKIAAFQEMLRKNQEREQMEIQHRPSSTRRSVANDDSQNIDDEEPTTQTRSTFKKNLNGLFALPGMALPGMKPPSVLSNEAKDEADEESAEPVANDARRARARGPRGKRLPKSASEKVEIVDRRVINVTDVWSTGCESEGYVLNKEEDKKSRDTPVVEELDVEDIPVEKVQTEEFVEEPIDDLADDAEEEAEEFQEVSTPAENDEDITDTEETISVSTSDITTTTTTTKNRTETSQQPSEEKHSSSTVGGETSRQDGDVSVAQDTAEPTVVEPTVSEPSIPHSDGARSDQSDLESFHDAANVDELKE